MYIYIYMYMLCVYIYIYIYIYTGISIYLSSPIRPFRTPHEDPPEHHDMKPRIRPPLK